MNNNNRDNGRNGKYFNQSDNRRGGQGGGHHRPAQSNATNHVWAPYNFVPLSEKVWKPAWGPLVSQDAPFRDGLSGKLSIRITAETPLLVGGGKSRRNKVGQGVTTVQFFKDSGGKFAIPGSSLKGLIRSVTEIASFSRFSFVDDRTLGVRELTSGVNFYTKKLTDQDSEPRHQGKKVVRSRSEAGFLYLEDGNWKLRPCRYGRIEHDDLDSFGIAHPPRVKFSESQGKRLFIDPHTPEEFVKKYEQLSKKDLAEGRIPSLKFYFKFQKFTPSNATSAADEADKRGYIPGLVVVTGSISRKHREFVFYHDKRSTGGDAITVEKKAIDSFLEIHHEQKSSNGPFAYWWTRLRRGEIGPGSSNADLLPGIPVFYLPSPDGRVTNLGLAQMFKMAYDYSIHDMIGHSATDHLETGGHDMASLLFGAVSEEEGRSLRGRVSFGLCEAEGDPREPHEATKVVLNGPKPSYYPFYVDQQVDTQNPGGPATGEHVETPYNTYMQSGQVSPKLRGWKRYVPKAAANPGKPPERDQDKVASRLKPLPAGTRFTGEIRFHNLRPAELGALVVSLTSHFSPAAEGRNALRGEHLLGMGKPYGYGRISLEVTAAELEPNVLQDGARESLCGDAAFSRLLEACVAFRATIERNLELKDGWFATAQIKALHQLSSVDGMRDYVGTDRPAYMALVMDKFNKANNHNPFALAKDSRGGNLPKALPKLPRGGR